jgi:hypothetical protein
VLNRNRGGAGERITQNTLIRVAVALLLSRTGDLAGTTEEELRRSVGLPDLQTPYLLSSVIDERPQACVAMAITWGRWLGLSAAL